MNLIEKRLDRIERIIYCLERLTHLRRAMFENAAKRLSFSRTIPREAAQGDFGRWLQKLVTKR